MPSRRASAQKSPGGQAPTAGADDSTGGFGRRLDATLAAAAALVALGMALAAASNTMSLGDAPEFTAAVKVLGIAHAPGYPTYVLLAHAFTNVVPIGSFVWRVGLFSAVCSSAATALLYLICRRLRFVPVASVAVAVLAATARSWWYNAAFAKPYALTELLFLGIIFAALAWRDRPGYRMPLVVGLLLGLASGASYQSVLLATPAVAILLLTGRRRPPVIEGIVAVVTAGTATVVLLAYEVVRARSSPPLDWGSPTSLGAIAQLLRMTDFHFGSKSALSAAAVSSAGSAAAGAAHQGAGAGVGRIAGIFLNVLGWPVELVGELTLLCLPLFLVGFVVWIRRPDRRRLVFLPALVVIQAIGLGAAINLHAAVRAGGITAFGSFWAPATLAGLLWIGLGLDFIARSGSRPASRRQPSLPDAGWGPWVAGTLATIVVATSVTLHWPMAHHGPAGMAEAYGHDELASLPDRAIFAVNGAEFGFPSIARQVLAGERRDVAVVFVDLLDRPWYRTQVATRLGVGRFPAVSGLQFLKLAAAKLPDRPIYVDGGTAIGLRNAVGLRLHGLVSQVVTSATDQTVDLEDTRKLITNVYNLAPLADRRASSWPNAPVRAEYIYAMLRYGFALGANGETPAANGVFGTILRWDPGNRGAIAGLDAGAGQSTARGTGGP